MKPFPLFSDPFFRRFFKSPARLASRRFSVVRPKLEAVLHFRCVVEFPKRTP
jgi:hypothetical protein